MKSQEGFTVSFQENVNGWVSFKSFIPENGVKCSNDYFTFKDGNLFRHHDESGNIGQNTFYNSKTLVNSYIDFIFNQAPGQIKSFKTINYEGSQALVESKERLWGALFQAQVGATVNLNSYTENFRLREKPGWTVESLETEQDKGTLKEFIEKEKKWFNYIYGVNLNVSDGNIVDNFDPKNFANQGLGIVTASPSVEVIVGCTCGGTAMNGAGVIADCTASGTLGYNFNDGTIAAFNYYGAAELDDGSCIEVMYGCIDINATNYIPAANTDDGSCYTLGCTDPTASNYDSNATVDDGSCTYCNYGCTNSVAFNYDTIFNCDGLGGVGGTSCVDLGLGIDCSCEEIEYGCLDTNDYSTSNTAVVNLSSSANTIDSSCVYSGCADINAEYPRVPFPIPYDSGFLSDVTGSNGAWAVDNAGNFITVNNFSASSGPFANSLLGCWDVIYNMQADISNVDYQEYLTSLDALSFGVITTLPPCPTNSNDTTNCTYTSIGCTDPLGCTFDAANTVDDGSCLYCGELAYFNYDSGYTLSGGVCGPNTNTGDCVSCPTVIQNSLVGVYSSTTATSSWDLTLSSPAIINLLNNPPSWLQDPGFKMRIYNLSTISSGGSAWNDADYEVVDFVSSFGSPIPFNFNNVTNANATVTITTDSPDLVHGSTIVSGSRQAGIINASAGYNNSTTLSLNCGQQYQVALQTQCINPNNNHLSNSNWEQNVGVFTMGACVGIPGCTDPTVSNYDPNATVDDGSCCVDGCTDLTATNYDPLNTCDDGSCTYDVLGCTNSTATNYNPLATIDDGSCNYGPHPIGGCIDPIAINYDPTANVDDGSCIYGRKGCTDPLATNYDPTATINDGTCTYGPVGCTECNGNACTYAIHPPFSAEVVLDWDPNTTPHMHVFDEYPGAANLSSSGSIVPGHCSTCGPHTLVLMPLQNHFMFEDGLIHNGATNVAGGSYPGPYGFHITDEFSPQDIYPIPVVPTGSGGHIKITTYFGYNVPTSIGGLNATNTLPWPEIYPALGGNGSGGTINQQANTFGKPDSGYYYNNFTDPIASATERFNKPSNAPHINWEKRYDGHFVAYDPNNYPPPPPHTTGAFTLSSAYPIPGTIQASGYAPVYNASELTSTFTGQNYNQVMPLEFSGGWTFGVGAGVIDRNAVGSQYGAYNAAWDGHSLEVITKNPALQYNQLFTVEMEVLDANKDRYCPRNFTLRTYIIAKQGTDSSNPTRWAAEDGSGLTFATQQELVEYFISNYGNMHVDGWTGPGPIIP